MPDNQKRGRPPRWTQDTADQLRALYAKGLTDAEIGRLMGRTPGAITAKRSGLGLTGASPFAHPYHVNTAFDPLDPGRQDDLKKRNKKFLLALLRAYRETAEELVRRGSANVLGDVGAIDV